MLAVEHAFQFSLSEPIFHLLDLLKYFRLELGVLFFHKHFEEHLGVLHLLPPRLPLLDDILELAVFLLDDFGLFGIVPEAGGQRLALQGLKPVFFGG